MTSCKRCGGGLFLDELRYPSCVVCGWQDYRISPEWARDRQIELERRREPEPEPEPQAMDPEPEPTLELEPPEPTPELTEDERLIARIDAELEPLLARVTELRNVRRKVKGRLDRVRDRKQNRERYRRWRQNNRERVQDYQNTWRKANPRYWDADAIAQRKSERERALEIEREEVCSVCQGAGHVDCVACGASA